MFLKKKVLKNKNLKETKVMTDDPKMQNIFKKFNFYLPKKFMIN